MYNFLGIKTLVILFSSLAYGQIFWDKTKAYKYLEISWSDHGFQSGVSMSKNMENIIASDKEIFSTALIMALLPSSDSNLENKAADYLKNFVHTDGMHFFEKHKLLPPDVDCTSFGCIALKKQIKSNYIKFFIKKIVSNINGHGVIKVYLTHEADRKDLVDPVVCSNALYAIYELKDFIDLRERVKETENFIYDILYREQYVGGSRYYHSPITFLWSVSRLLSFRLLKKRFRKLLKNKIKKAKDHLDNPLDLAMWIIAATNAGLTNINEPKKKLAQLQNLDGSWPAYSLFRYGRQTKYFGSKQITTVFAICALTS